MTPFQWGPSPPEPESYSATSTGTPAPLSPDVAELVRRVRQVDYAEDAGGYLLMDALRNNAAAFARRLAEQDAIIAELQRRQRSDEDQLCRIAKSLGKDARHSEDGTIAGLVYELRERAEKAERERDELLASYQKVVGEHNGLVLAGDSLLAKAGQYRIERDAAVERAEKADKERDARPAYIYCHPCGYQSRSMVCTKHGGMCNRKFEELVAERDAALAKCRELEDTLQSLQTK